MTTPQEQRAPSGPARDRVYQDPNNPEPARQLSWGERQVVGRFRLLAGGHSEGGVLYSPGQEFDSKSDLRRQNFPGAQKFQLVGDINEEAIQFNNGEGAVPAAMYVPENPHTLPPEESDRFRQTGLTPGQEGLPGNQPLGASTAGSNFGAGGPEEQMRAQQRGQAPVMTPTGGRGYSENELREISKAEILELGAEYEYDLPKSGTKEELVEAFMKAQKANAQPPAATQGATPAATGGTRTSNNPTAGQPRR